MTGGKTFPRIMLCAPGSGSGKTMITCALLKVLERHGFKPASFKCGPDYIDPMFHKDVLGIPSRNMDIFLMGREGVNRTLARGSRDRDFGVIEGVMGFYDGVSATSFEGSSYDICATTGTPAILVVNCKGMSASVIPLIKGFHGFDKEDLIQGVILNNISPNIADEIREAVEYEVQIPVVGVLPKMPEASLENRHLGLMMPGEIPGLRDMVEKIADKLEEGLDLDRLLMIARLAEDIRADEAFYIPEEYKKAPGTYKVGVARDEAFSFYYEDNFDLLRLMGAEIVPFSPIHDKKLPEVTHLIIGGGYPEVHAEALSMNTSMRMDILRAAKTGVPILAECGGFLYLQERLRDFRGENYEMVGVLPGQGHMTDHLVRFGYVTMSGSKKGLYLKKDEEIRAHEFHYCDTTDNGDECQLTKPSGKSWRGYRTENKVFAGFPHLYYPSCPEFIKRFLDA